MIANRPTLNFLLIYIACMCKNSFGFVPGYSSRGMLQPRRIMELKSSKSFVDKNTAIEKLQKLLQRQKLEAEQTEELIRKLSADSTSTMDVSEKIEQTHEILAVQTEHEDHEQKLKEALPTIAGLDIQSEVARGVDYGFVSRSEGKPSELSGGMPVEGFDANISAFDEYGPPTNIFKLGFEAFFRNLDAIRGEYTHEDEKKLTKKQKELQDKLSQLTLNSTAIWEREKENNQVDAPLVIEVPYFVLCYMLDWMFEGKYTPSRFYLLETVARVPYFSYISMLHLYETLGWWRSSSDVKRVHFAEEWNEFHHLLIMESLGGDQEWWVRFLALHSAIAYYWVLVGLWVLSPTLGYKFSELLETHAVNTYSQFVDENEELLKELPPTLPAVEYYCYGASDSLFSEYQTSAAARGEPPRRPGDTMKSMYDVFSAIRDDEGDHVSTMKACLDPTVAVNSPSIEKQILVGGAALAATAYFLSTGDLIDVDMDLIESSDDLINDVAGFAALGERLLSEEDTGFLEQLFNGQISFEFDTFESAGKTFSQLLDFLLDLIKF